jgi:hypothetical protein
LPNVVLLYVDVLQPLVQNRVLSSKDQTLVVATKGNRPFEWHANLKEDVADPRKLLICVA